MRYHELLRDPEAVLHRTPRHRPSPAEDREHSILLALMYSNNEFELDALELEARKLENRRTHSEIARHLADAEEAFASAAEKREALPQ
jgi:hypothetical protein